MNKKEDKFDYHSTCKGLFTSDPLSKAKCAEKYEAIDYNKLSRSELSELITKIIKCIELRKKYTEKYYPDTPDDDNHIIIIYRLEECLDLATEIFTRKSQEIKKQQEKKIILRSKDKDGFITVFQKKKKLPTKFTTVKRLLDWTWKNKINILKYETDSFYYVFFLKKKYFLYTIDILNIFDKYYLKKNNIHNGYSEYLKTYNI